MLQVLHPLVGRCASHNRYRKLICEQHFFGFGEYLTVTPIPIYASMLWLVHPAKAW